jgi:peptidoglycan/LPS O-acetylase OafA/YrhL
MSLAGADAKDTGSVQAGAGTEWSIELLRGVAALMVVLVHYHAIAAVDPGPLRFAYTGVDLFFVISGFVFAPYLYGRPLPVAAHLVRRFFRLYPLYAVALACYAWLHLSTGRPVDHLLEHALFLHTLQSREIAFHFNPAFWSLPPEVEFYLALPLLAWLAGSLRPVLAIAGAAALVHVVLARMSPAEPLALNAAAISALHLPGLLVEFMLGALAWHVARRPLSGRARIALVAAGVLGWCGLAAVDARLGDAGLAANPWLRGNVSVLAAMAFAAIVAGFIGSIRRPPPRLVSLAQWLGNVSYGVYLFHNAAPVALSSWRGSLPGVAFALLCLAATLAVAHLLHATWEAPLRRWGRRLAKRIDRRRLAVQGP